MSEYRRRIYGSYVAGREDALAPTTVAGLIPRAAYLRRLIGDHFPVNKDSRILDLGCGHGAILYFAQEAGFSHVRGIDGAPEQVAAAHNLGVAGVEQGDIHTALTDTPDNSLDVVITFDVIEHFKRDELIPLVDAIYRVLKPGGRWIIHVPNGESPFGARMRYYDLTHELAFTRVSIGQLLYSSGFTEVECFEDKPAPHGFKSLIRAILWRVIRVLLLGWIAVETGELDRRAIFSQNLLSVAVK